MSNKYKLLKDFPDAKAGDMVYWDNFAKEYYVTTSTGSRIYIQESNIHNVEWFQPITVEEEVGEKIEVTQMWDLNNVYEPQCVRTGFCTSKPIPEHLFPAVKKAINDVLNPTTASKEEPETNTDEKFLQYLTTQKNKFVKQQDFETASNWRMVEKLFKDYLDLKFIQNKPPTGNWVSLEEVVDTYLKTLPKENPVPPTPLKEKEREKDWEIECFILKGDRKYRLAGNKLYNHGTGKDHVAEDFDYCLKHGSIHSVKKVSTGEIFSIADEVQFKSHENIGWDEQCFGKIISITPARQTVNQIEFEIYDEEIMESSAHKFIENIRPKLPPKETTKEVSYTQGQMNKAIENAFFAGRSIKCEVWAERTQNWEYPTVIDYLNKASKRNR